MSKQPKIALVCDWLTNMGGAEHLLLTLHKAFPDAPIYTSVFEPEGCPLFQELDIRTTYLQRLPRFLRRRHQLFPVPRAYAFRSLDLSEYDVVISSASAEAKSIRVRPGAVHICYCHTPTRYYWSHYDEYARSPGFGLLNPLVRLLLPRFVDWMRKLDLQAAKGVSYFIANSHEVQARIKQYYRRDATVIFPPVNTELFKPAQPVKKEEYYLLVGRQIAYKRFDLAIEACNQLKRRLIIIGNGSEHQKLVKLAGPTIEFLTNVSDIEKVTYLQRARAFIFPALEDFGIAPVEAMAAGTPVIAYNRGGSLDSVKPGVSGMFFDRQTPESLMAAIEIFEKTTFPSEAIIAYADAFDESVFITRIQAFVSKQLNT